MERDVSLRRPLTNPTNNINGKVKRSGGNAIDLEGIKKERYVGFYASFLSANFLSLCSLTQKEIGNFLYSCAAQGSTVDR